MVNFGVYSKGGWKVDKLIVGIAVVCFSTFIGYLATKKYRRRKLFFTQWTLFNERFLGEVSYYRRPIGEFYRRFSYQGEFNDFLIKYLNALTAQTDKSHLFDGLNFLEKDDKATLEDYFLTLGKGDSASQKAYFSTAKQVLSNRLNAVETDAKKYGDLYLKLGFLCGLGLLIIIV